MRQGQRYLITELERLGLSPNKNHSLKTLRDAEEACNQKKHNVEPKVKKVETPKLVEVETKEVEESVVKVEVNEHETVTSVPEVEEEGSLDAGLNDEASAEESPDKPAKKGKKAPKKQQD